MSGRVERLANDSRTPQNLRQRWEKSGANGSIGKTALQLTNNKVLANGERFLADSGFKLVVGKERTVFDQRIVELQTLEGGFVEYKDGGRLAAATGFGTSIKQAKLNLLESISKGTLVLNAYQADRREIAVPNFASDQGIGRFFLRNEFNPIIVPQQYGMGLPFNHDPSVFLEQGLDISSVQFKGVGSGNLFLGNATESPAPEERGPKRFSEWDVLRSLSRELPPPNHNFFGGDVSSNNDKPV